MKACPHCRLPIRRPGRVYGGENDAGVFVVYLLCQPCVSRLDRLPTSPRVKALNRCFVNVNEDPGRFAYRAFGELIQAQLFVRLAGDPATAAGVVNSMVEDD